MVMLADTVKEVEMAEEDMVRAISSCPGFFGGSGFV